MFGLDLIIYNVESVKAIRKPDGSYLCNILLKNVLDSCFLGFLLHGFAHIAIKPAKNARSTIYLTRGDLSIMYECKIAGKDYLRDIHTLMLETLSQSRMNSWKGIFTRPLKIPANSQAMYPPPTINIFFGRCGNSRASLDVIACSMPGMEGRNGQLPVWGGWISAWKQMKDNAQTIPR